MTAAALALAVLLQAQPLITDVELRLPPQTDPQVLKEAPGLVAVAKGQELSQRGLRRTIERLMRTGAFSEVVIWGEDQEAGVAVVIEARLRQRVREVFVEKGTSALSTGEVVAASKLESGSEYSAESLTEAVDLVKQAYRRKGYLRAEAVPVTTESGGGVDVLLQINEGEPTRLAAVSLAGESGLPLKRIVETLELELGEIVDQDAVDRGADRLRALLRRENFYRARVEPPILDERGNLLIPLRSGPRYTMQFRGNRRFPDSMLEAVNAYEGAEQLDRASIEAMAERLATFYRYRGFHEVRVAGRESVSPDGRRALLVMEIDEGEVVVVRQVDFTGNAAVSDQELKTLLFELMEQTKPTSAKLSANFSDALHLQGRMHEPALFDAPTPDLGTVLVDAVYRDAAAAARALYRDRGYLEAKVELESIVIENRGATIRYAISEGSRVYVRDVKYVGGPPGFPSPERRNGLLGEPLSTRGMERTAQALATELAAQGYLYAKVDGQWTVKGATEGHVVFQVALGPQVRTGKVTVQGLLRTDEAVARRQLTIEEGKVLSPDDLLDSQRNLIGLGIFRTAEVRLKSPEVVEAIKDIDIELTEAPRIQFEGYFGYYLAEGVRGGVDLQVPNLGGRALTLLVNLQTYYFGASAPASTGRVDVSNIPLYFLFGGRGNVSLQNRGLLARGLAWVLGGDNRVARAVRMADIGTRVDVVAERVFRQSYQFNRVAAVPGLDWSGRFDVGVKWARLKLTLLLQYEFDVSDVQPVRSFIGEQLPLLRTDQERLRFSFGTFALSTFRFAPTLDLRDDAVLPHRGFVLSTSVESTEALYARNSKGNDVPVRFIKVSGQVTSYFPIGPAVVLAVSARLGNIFPATKSSITPPVKRFYVGGAASLRGFPEDSMLPEDVRAAYRTEAEDCQRLAVPYGCTEVAQNLREGRYVPSPGGEFYAIGKTELRFPFVGDFNLGLFLEAGNLWLDPNRLASAVRPVAGTGLRYLSPIGPLALDIGFNLLRDTVVNEALFNVHFNVGVF